MEALTGKEAADAVGIVMHLGNAEARFDARRVSAALRSARGRYRITVGLASAAFAAAFARVRPPRATRSGRPGRTTRSLTAAESPGRPPTPRAAEEG